MSKRFWYSCALFTGRALVLSCFFSLNAAADSAAPSPALPVDADVTPSAAPLASSDTDDGSDRSPWFWSSALSNYHPKLEESEALIDKQINGVFGRLCPNWEEPITFKDWSDEFKIWDDSIVIGRDIGPKSAWFAGIGYARGTIKNNKLYFPLGLPLTIDADFTRAETFVTTGLSYYPWGQPVYSESGKGLKGRLAGAVRGARPYVEGSVGFVRLYKYGDVRLNLPWSDRRIYRKEEEDVLKLFQVSPRVGIEFPVSEKDSVAVSGFHQFFLSHGDELDSNSFALIWKRRFGSKSKD